jgi:hypothetical protein
MCVCNCPVVKKLQAWTGKVKSGKHNSLNRVISCVADPRNSNSGIIICFMYLNNVSHKSSTPKFVSAFLIMLSCNTLKIHDICGSYINDLVHKHNIFL